MQSPKKFTRRGTKPVSITPPLHYWYDFENITKVDTALQMFDEMLRTQPQPSIRKFTQLISVVINMNHFLPALSLLNRLNLLGISNLFTINMSINCYSHLNMSSYGFSLLGRIYKLGYLPSNVTFNTLINGLALEGRIVEAYELFKKLVLLKCFEPNEVTYNTIMNGLCKTGKTTMAISLLKAMEKEGLKTNTISYNTIINGLCKEKMIDDALRFLQEMIDKSILPDIITYNCLIQGLCDLSRWRDVMWMLDEMCQKQTYPDVTTYNMLVNALCKEGEIKHAEDIILKMIQSGVRPDVVTYTSLIGGYCLQGKMSEANKVFNELCSKGLQPDVRTYTALIYGLCQDGLVEKAKALLIKMEGNGCTPNEVTYNILLGELLKRKAGHEALIHFGNLVERGFSPTDDNLAMLIDILPTEGQDPTLLHMIQKFVPIDRIKSLSPTHEKLPEK